MHFTVVSFGLGTLISFTQLVTSTLYKANETCICKGGRFRTLDHLNVIKECEVLEGNLILAFKLTNSESEWRGFEGLKVKEVTGYIIFYLVDHLTTLELVLPELRVIRGNELLKNYALVIYGLMHLKYIGLTKLSDILRGSVAIKNNPVLSYYTHTVEWEYITHWNGNNRNSHSNFIQVVDSQIVICPENCSLGVNKKDRVCWYQNACQTVCHSNETGFALSCMELNKSRPCPEDCVGGCYERNGQIYCHACKYFHYQDSDQCNQDCFPLYYEYKKYRCISKEECTKKQWKLLETKRKKCVEKCPSNYEDDNDMCVPCKDHCTKVCNGGIIDSVGEAERFAGCTRVNGSLEIRVLTSQITNDLVPLLGQIQEVDDYVRIYESSKIQSLQFLNNLTVIRGKKLWQNRYSLIVHDNDELQELWRVSSPINITEGKVLFHTNPKLCPLVIERLVGETKWKHSIENELLRRILNGNKKACDVNPTFKFMARATSFHGTLNISIDSTRMEQNLRKRLVVGFFVFYQETTNENSDYYGKRKWMKHFKEYNAVMEDRFYILLQNLKPATMYAIYLETQTTNFLQNFRSTIKYVSTHPFNPSEPKDLTLVKAGKNYIEINWEKPEFLNGVIYQYIISIKPMPFEDDWSNLCDGKVRELLWAKMKEQNSQKEKENRLPLTEKKNVSSESTHYCPNAEEVNKVKVDRLEHFDLGNELSKIISKKYSMTKISQKRLKRELKDTIFLMKNCGNPNITIYETRNRRSVNFGGLRRVLRNPSNDTELQLHRANASIIVPNTLNKMKHQLIEYAKFLSLDNLIPYFQLQNLSKQCLHYLLFLTEELTDEDETALQEPSLSNSLQQFEECNINFASSSHSKWCRYMHSPNELVVKESDLRPIQIQVSPSSAYEIKMKACHQPTTACEKEECLLLCSFRFAKKIVRVTQEVYTPSDDLRVRNVKILETAGNRVKIAWSSPLFWNEKEISAYEIITHQMQKSSTNSTDSSKRSLCVSSSTKETWLKNLIPGNHSVEIAALSYTNGELLPSQKAYFVISESVRGVTGSKEYLIVIAFILILFICSVLVYVKVSRENRKKMIAKMVVTPNPHYDSRSQEDGRGYPQWKMFLKSEIEPQFIHLEKHLQFLSKLDEGYFGQVWQATLGVYHPRSSRFREIYVAAKTGKGTSNDISMQQLIKEAKLMLKIRSYHLVRTYGVVSSDTELFLVMELMHHGSLNKYLNFKRKSDNIFDLFTIKQVIKFSIQIADGMAYLSSKNIFHMDLAARNCLLNANLNVKISDFGLSRLINGEYYYISGIKKVAYRWMPPEYLLQNKFTAKSDVWSYGIVLWEIVNPGKRPYPDLDSLDAVKEEVCSGHTLLQHIPNEVPSVLASLMGRCWHFCQSNRPDFNYIVNYLLNLEYTDENFKSEFKNKSFFYCGDQADDDDDFIAWEFSSSENPESIHLDVDEDALPSTPLTKPSFPSVAQIGHSVNSRQGHIKSKTTRNRVLFPRWRHYLSSARQSLTISSPCPFVCTFCKSSYTDNPKHSCTEGSVNNLATEFSKFNSPKSYMTQNSCKISLPLNHDIL